MNYVKTKNQIKIFSLDDFNAQQILECGQIFRFNIDGNVAKVYSKNKKAEIETKENQVIISTNDVDYFEHFFDLKTDYKQIKNAFANDEFLGKAVKHGYGIRILNNDAYEMIISFIISANNNIKRIKNSIEYLCKNFGSNVGEYYAFPTLSQLKQAKVEDYKMAGLGYRAEYMFETVQRLSEQDIETLKELPASEQFEFLVSLKGVGEKVANCIMLFGLGVKNVFPVDTWINKVYNSLTNSTETNRKKM